MEPKRYFFIIGLPRTRSAWLSVLLSQGGVFCWHEALLSAGGFDGMKSRMQLHFSPVVGNADSGLLFHAERLHDDFPGARFVVIHRDPADALASVMAAHPESAAVWQEEWPAVIEQFERLAGSLPETGVMHVQFDDLARYSECARIVEHCTGGSLNAQWWAQLQNLRIEQVGDLRPSVRENSLVVDVAPGLSVRKVLAADIPMISGWSKHHGSEALPVAALPPLGVVIEDEAGPAAALWCHESFGVGSASLDYAVTRPGMNLKQAGDAMRAAVQACMALAGKGVEPPGEFHVFRAVVSPAQARWLESIGFRVCATNKTRMIIEV